MNYLNLNNTEGDILELPMNEIELDLEYSIKFKEQQNSFRIIYNLNLVQNDFDDPFLSNQQILILLAEEELSDTEYQEFMNKGLMNTPLSSKYFEEEMNEDSFNPYLKGFLKQYGQLKQKQYLAGSQVINSRFLVDIGDTIKQRNNLKSLQIHQFQYEIEGDNSHFDQFCECLGGTADTLTFLDIFIMSKKLLNLEWAIHRAISKLVNLQKLQFQIYRQDFTFNVNAVPFGNSIRPLQSLRELSIYQELLSNDLYKFGDGLRALQNIRKLEIYLNPLMSEQSVLDLMEGICSIVELEELKAQLQLMITSDFVNQIDINKPISKLVNLKKFIFTCNTTTKSEFKCLSYSEGLNQLINLQDLRLQFGDTNSTTKNIFESIQAFQSLTNLKSLELSFNFVSLNDANILNQFQQSFKKLVNLERLHLSFHSIQISDDNLITITNVISNLSQLTSLSLKFLRLNSLNCSDFQNLGEVLQKLKKLNYLQLFFMNCAVDDAWFKELQEGIFSLTELSHLSITFNACQNICCESFKGFCLKIESLKQLKELYISHLRNVPLLKKNEFCKQLLYPITKNQSIESLKIVIDGMTNIQYLQRKIKRLVKVH